jgi:hypothetical protein
MNFLACAHFHQIYFEAFNEKFLGWRLGEVKQFNPDCLFGDIKAILWSFEESGRRGIHGHSPLYVSTLNAANLRRLYVEGETMRVRLVQFAESISMAYMPSAFHADEWRLQPQADAPAVTNPQLSVR